MEVKMNSNFDWQNHQANERIQARLDEAHIHRSLKQKNKQGKLTPSILDSFVLLPISSLATLITLLSLLFIIGLFLIACGGQESEGMSTASEKPQAEKAVVGDSNTPPVDEPKTPPADSEVADSWVRPVDSMTMVYVPEGSFPMGREAGFSNETPAHKVSLAAFWIDSTEVTNEQYALCVKSGSCEPAKFADDSLFNDDNYPIVGVSWYAAEAYCDWADAQLPTEAEWEYAARGPEGLTFPWGNSFNEENANSCDTNCKNGRRDERNDDGYGFTAPVGNYSSGKSWVGALDMSGNTAEWVKDWYDDAYYNNSPATNPQGPDSGEIKVQRGGGWNSTVSDSRSTSRDSASPDDGANNVGFRCAVVPGK